MPSKGARRGRKALSKGWEGLGWGGWTFRGGRSVGRLSRRAGWGQKGQERSGVPSRELGEVGRPFWRAASSR